MKFTKIILGIVVAFSMASCQFATFTAKPGVPVKEYPKDMYGSYQHIQKSGGVRDTYTLVINEKGATVSDIPLLGRIGQINLNDTSTNTISHLGDFYFMNGRVTDSAGNSYWYVYPFEYDKKNLYIYKLVISKKSIKRMAKMGLQPSGRHEHEYKMENEPFRQYCEKYMKKKDAMVFKRIK